MFFSDVEIPSTYHLIDNPKKMGWLVSQLTSCREMAFDIETNHPTTKGKGRVDKDYKYKVVGISFSWNRVEVTNPWVPGVAAYLPLHKSDDSAYWGAQQDNIISGLREILESDVPKVAHNAKFDVRHIANLMGIYTKNTCFDTMMAHALLDEERLVSSHALKSDYSADGKRVIKLGVSDAYLNTQAGLFKDDLQQALQFYDPHLKRYSKVPMKTLYPYACADADLTLSLKFVFEPLLANEQLTWLNQNLIMTLSHALMLMELHGVPLDMDVAKQVLSDQLQIMENAEREIHRICGTKFNVGSPQQMGDMLFVTLGLDGHKSRDGKWVTDADALKKLDHPVIPNLLEYRRAQQISGLYAEAALDKVEEVTNEGRIGWVHATYWMDSVTGRLKCTDPNLTTLPRPENGGMTVKSMWCTDADHYMIFKDFSQIELRVIAHVSGEPVWVDGFNAGHDMHAAMAHRIYKLPCEVSQVSKMFPAERSKAKAVNFGIAYGRSEYSLADDLGITPDEARHLIEVEYFGAAPVLSQWIQDTHEFVKNYGYVQNIFGRRRHLPDAMLPIPNGVQGPRWDDRPSCYFNGPNANSLGITREVLFGMTPAVLNDLVLSKKGKYQNCKGCRHLYSCTLNGEARYVKGRVNRALRQSVNSPIQGSAVDMASLSLVQITNDLIRYEVDAAPILHIHDELVVYSHAKDVERVCKIMDHAMTVYLMQLTDFRVPLIVDTEIVQRWSDKHLKED